MEQKWCKKCKRQLRFNFETFVHLCELCLKSEFGKYVKEKKDEHSDL